MITGTYFILALLFPACAHEPTHFFSFRVAKSKKLSWPIERERGTERKVIRFNGLIKSLQWHIFYSCLWCERTVFYKSLLQLETENAKEMPCDMMIPHYWFKKKWIILIRFEKENEREKCWTESKQSTQAFSHRNVANNVDLFKCIQHLSRAFFSVLFRHFYRSVSLIFRSFSLSLSHSIRRNHSIHFTCHIIHVLIFFFKINRLNGTCSHNSMAVSFSIQFMIFSQWIINVYSVHWIRLFYSSHSISFNLIPFCTLPLVLLKFDCHTDR